MHIQNVTFLKIKFVNMILIFKIYCFVRMWAYIKYIFIND